MNTESAEAFLRDGCGRCEHYTTPQCKVHRWTGPLEALRTLLLATDLTETMKWGSPCYMLGGKNVVMLVALTDYCGLSFFKGAALSDPDGALESPGPNSRLGRVLKVRSLDDVARLRTTAEGLIAAAIAFEQSGAPVDVDPVPVSLPEELAQAFGDDPAFREAFEALTPGRRRSHVLHIRGAKQAATRIRRVARCRPKVLAGRGFNER